MKKNGKWFLLILSVFFLADNLKILLNEFAESYVFLPYYLLMAVICITAAYYLARDLELLTGRPDTQPVQSEPSPKKIELGKKMTELDWFVVYNRDLLDKHLANRGTSIELHNGFNLPPGNFTLICKKNPTGYYDAKIFPKGSKTEAPYDETNHEHQELYKHLRLMLENYNNPSRMQEVSDVLKKNVVPIRRH